MESTGHPWSLEVRGLPSQPGNTVVAGLAGHVEPIEEQAAAEHSWSSSEATSASPQQAHVGNVLVGGELTALFGTFELAGARGGVEQALSFAEPVVAPPVALGAFATALASPAVAPLTSLPRAMAEPLKANEHPWSSETTGLFVVEVPQPVAGDAAHSDADSSPPVPTTMARENMSTPASPSFTIMSHYTTGGEVNRRSSSHSSSSELEHIGGTGARGLSGSTALPGAIRSIATRALQLGSAALDRRRSSLAEVEYCTSSSEDTLPAPKFKALRSGSSQELPTLNRSNSWPNLPIISNVVNKSGIIEAPFAMPFTNSFCQLVLAVAMPGERNGE
jgi:hypothetical protein